MPSARLARFDESLFMRIPDLNLDLVRCFVTVVETAGFTQASKRLHLTQSAITQKIKRLENLLQRRLFVRTIKPLELSAEGEILLTYAPRLLGLSREMAQRVSKPPQNEALRLGIVEQFGYNFLRVWLSELKREWPDVRLVSDIGVTTDPLKGLEEDRFDLVIASAGYTTMERSKSASLLQEQHLQKETLVWVRAEKSKIDSKKDPLPLVTLGPLSRYRPIALEALRKEGRSWEIVFDSPSLSSVQSAIVADLGLSVLSPFSVIPGMKVVAKGGGLPPLPTSDLALYSRKSPPQLAVQKLASFIANAVDRWENEVPRVDCLKNLVVLSVQRLGSNDHAYS
jgi:DNA-binding transcriptional LysR family regulator